MGQAYPEPQHALMQALCMAAEQVTSAGQHLYGLRPESHLKKRGVGVRWGARLAVLEWAGHELGLMYGTRTRGRKPTGMGEAYPAIQTAVRQTLRRNTRGSKR
jgi:hypothetical protein